MGVVSVVLPYIPMAGRRHLPEALRLHPCPVQIRRTTHWAKCQGRE